MGDVASALTSLTANAEDQAEAQAIAYAWSLYDQYQTQIWCAGIALTFWVIWVSTRDTYSKHESKTASAST